MKTPSLRTLVPMVPKPPDTEIAPPPRCEIATEPNTTVNLGAFLHEARDDGFPALVRSERPPPPAASGERTSAGRAAQMAAVAAVALVAGVLVTVAVIRVAGGRGKVASATRPSPATTSSAPPVRTGPCVAGERRVLARGVRLAAGVETAGSATRLAAAVSTSPREARAVEIDASTLAVRATARLTTTSAVKRAVPLLSDDGMLDVEADDAASYVVADGTARRVDGNVDAVRAAPLAGSVDAVVFRREGRIWAFTSSEAGVIDGPVALSHEGDLVGAPSVVGTRAGDVVATWAERASASEPWAVRWTRWTPGTDPGPARTLPEVGIAPSVAAAPGGALLLAWTEGTGGAHSVRAMALGPDGSPRGRRLELSAPGVNAGQERVVLSPDGLGAVFFLEAGPDGRFALVARGVSCEPL